MSKNTVTEIAGVDLDKFDVGEMLREMIRREIEDNPRSQQTTIGASEIGTPCKRKLALKMLETPPVPEQDSDDKWRATVGTAVHKWLAEMLDKDNARLAQEAHEHWKIHRGAKAPLCHPWCPGGTVGSGTKHVHRWLVESALTVGTVDGTALPGNLDVFDRLTHTLVDWKVPGPTAIKRVKRERDPGDEYRVQVQLYGRGLRQLGEDVQWVGIMFLPSNGELKMSWYWEEEFDAEVGNAAMRHAREIKHLVDREGRAIISTLPTTDDHCTHCPFFAPTTRDFENECPGDPSLEAKLKESWSDIFPDGIPPR